LFLCRIAIQQNRKIQRLENTGHGVIRINQLLGLQIRAISS
jgi:hypothetical protein